MPDMKCPKCGSTEVVKFGKYPSVSEGKKKQRYRCHRGHTFYKPKTRPKPKPKLKKQPKARVKSKGR